MEPGAPSISFTSKGVSRGWGMSLRAVITLAILATTTGSGIYTTGGETATTSREKHTTTGSEITFNTDVFGGMVGTGEWASYNFLAVDDSANIYIEATTRSDRADALSLYIFERELPSEDRRRAVGAPIDADEFSSVVKNGERTYSVVLGQCYVQPQTRYYVAIRSGPGQFHTQFKVRATLIPALLPLNEKVSASICDQRYLHFYWQLDSELASGAMQTMVTRTAGALDGFYVRYERCAGPSKSNLGYASLEGQGGQIASSVVIPEPGGSYVNNRRIPPAGRYYVSVKGKMDMCGSFEMSIEQLSQGQLNDYVAPQASRSWVQFQGGFGIVTLACILCICLCAARFCHPNSKMWSS